MKFLFLLPLILLVCFFCIAFFVNAAMFKPYKKIKPPAEGRKMTVKSGKNHLAGYLWNESGTRGLIVFAHGMGTGVEYYLPEIHHFAALGYKVFAFEYSGYPGSSGHFYGFPQAVIDLKNALDLVNDGSLPVILMGHSMGAYAVCCAGEPVDAIVAYAPFFSSDEAVIAEANGSIPKYGRLVSSLVLPMQRILFGRNCDPNAVAGLSRAKAPTLVLQGSEDVEVTPDGCALYAHRAEFVPELKVVSGHIFTKSKSSALTNEEFLDFIKENGIDEFYVVGADAAACIKSTCYNMTKGGYTVHVLSDCITSYDKKKLPELLAYYESKGCSVMTLEESALNEKAV